LVADWPLVVGAAPVAVGSPAGGAAAAAKALRAMMAVVAMAVCRKDVRMVMPLDERYSIAVISDASDKHQRLHDDQA
jgi:hypothetical protein